MPPRRLLFVIAGLCFLLSVDRRTDAYLTGGESIEWVTARSERIIVGKLTKAEWITSDNHEKLRAVTVAVSRTLKGPAGDEAIFLLRNGVSVDLADRWQAEAAPLLFFLVRNEAPHHPLASKKMGWLLRGTSDIPSVAFLGKPGHEPPGCMPVLTCDFDVLTESEAILKCVAQVVESQSKGCPARCYTLITPGATPVLEKLYAGSAVLLAVPVDAKLEVLARRWCKSKVADERWQGAQILRYFKNDQNIALLKSLLDDPEHAESCAYEGGPGVPTKLIYRKTVYYVRYHAFASLAVLGATVKKPVIEILLEGSARPQDEVDDYMPSMDLTDLDE